MIHINIESYSEDNKRQETAKRKTIRLSQLLIKVRRNLESIKELIKAHSYKSIITESRLELLLILCGYCLYNNALFNSTVIEYIIYTMDPLLFLLG